MISLIRRQIWIYTRILWRRWQYRREIATTPLPYPVAERRFPIPPSRMCLYARAADEITCQRQAIKRQSRSPVPRPMIVPQPQSPPLLS